MIDESTRLPGFTELRRQSLNVPETGEYLALAGDCATQHLATAIQGYAAYAGESLRVFDADYNQIVAHLTDPDSELYAVKPAYLMLALCVERLWEEYCRCTDREQFARNQAAEIRRYWDAFSERCPGGKILQFNFPELDDGIFGNFSQKVPGSFLNQTRRLNVFLSDMATEYKNAFLVDVASLQNRLGRGAFSDPKLYALARMPFSLTALPYLAKAVIDVVRAINGQFKKCVVLDLDNTLWGGVIGDDGLAGIQIGELGTGRAFSAFQLWLKELKKRGILLAVCSKNNEDTAKEVFVKHPDMALRLEDFAAFVANWEDKASNIRFIQQTLNLGLDSFVFLDDNPFERNLVRSLLPDVTVPELPEDPAEYVAFCQSLNLFETASYSEADADRTRQYQEEMNRAGLQRRYASFSDYLQSLDMVAEAKPFDPFHYPRIAQLTQRSNQFNLRTVRYTEAEIEQAANDPDKLTLYFTLRDKFGDYGLISVVILDKLDADTLFIDTWLMSCRVLKRGMEEFIIDEIVACARSNGFKRIEAEYLPTPKNAMVKDIYEKLGFTPFGAGRYVCDTATFHNHKTWIQQRG